MAQHSLSMKVVHGKPLSFSNLCPRMADKRFCSEESNDRITSHGLSDSDCDDHLCVVAVNFVSMNPLWGYFSFWKWDTIGLAPNQFHVQFLQACSCRMKSSPVYIISADTPS